MSTSSEVKLQRHEKQPVSNGINGSPSMRLQLYYKTMINWNNDHYSDTLKHYYIKKTVTLPASIYSCTSQQ